ncbi:MAG: mannose-1-phosphate guanyltransferase [Verrucomicrobia bacterium RIFCSPLOWO2_12_FULL_64_8]|nr:MAG: mannose-1-phosphate guanyltransferase [Verrucomicrobia bacterium RIFCSPLOWO2_12_FULL_64_8]
MAHHFIVILAGGKGERFWPQSRERHPKHLLPIVGDQPMLVQTVARVRPLVPARRILIITSAAQKKRVAGLCPQIPRENIIAEPTGRDTAAAVGLAALLIERRDPMGIFAILPADHAIKNAAAFRRDVRAALGIAAKPSVIATIGIKPFEPATGYGYIHRGERLGTAEGRHFHRVRRFVEKPDEATARRYLASGEYYWNAGMFFWSVPTILAAFARHAPDLQAGLEKIRRGLADGRALVPLLRRVYPTLPRISVDYALLERAGNVTVLPAAFDWDDVGAWPAVARHLVRDESGNVVRGHAVIEDGHHNIVINEGSHFTAVLGADNLVVVHARGATLVCPREKAQQIKKLLQRLATHPQGRKLL